MQARVKKSHRFSSIVLFSGHEFTKAEFRKVPDGFEEQARKHEDLEVREGKAEKEIEAEKAEASVKKVMKARLISTHPDPALRTNGGVEYVKDEWREVPEGFEQPSRDHELLEVWEAGAPEPGKKNKDKSKEKDKEKSGLFAGRSTSKKKEEESDSDSDSGEKE